MITVPLPKPDVTKGTVEYTKKELQLDMDKIGQADCVVETELGTALMSKE